MSQKNTSHNVIGFLLFGKKDEQKYIHLFSEHNAILIREGLEALLRVDGSPIYVSVEDVATGNLLQFAGSSKDKLFFNLPAKQFTKSEIRRARSVLNPYKIRYTEEPLFLDEQGNRGDALKTFSKNIGDNIDLALEICSKVFFDIYQAREDVRLRVSLF